MTITTIGRRQFLTGAGGAALAIPFLPSLVAGTAHAQALSEAPSRLVCFGTGHGGIWGGNMYPGDHTLTQRTAYLPGHDVRHGALALSPADGQAQLSPLLSADSDRLTPELVAKMNILRGVDLPFYLGHHFSGYLGAYGGNHNGPQDPAFDVVPTIDQVMAYSPNFYPDLSGITRRTIQIGQPKWDGSTNDREMSWTHSNPVTRTGPLQPVLASQSPWALFQSLFAAPRSPRTNRRRVLDRLVDSYRTLRDGDMGWSRRISRDDRRVLSDHMERFAEIERRLGVQSTCEPTMPSGLGEGGERGTAHYRPDDSGFGYVRLYNEVVAMAFRCDVSRIAVIDARSLWTEFQGDWHQDVVHVMGEGGGNVRLQELVVAENRTFFQEAFLDLCQRLETQEGEGRTVLDNTLVFWTQEAGKNTHQQNSLPIVTAGSAGGRFTTGQYIDYRRRGDQTMRPRGAFEGFVNERDPEGVLYNQWLATVLRSMGVAPRDFERNGTRGYGLLRREEGGFGQGSHSPEVLARASELLPVVTNV